MSGDWTLREFLACYAVCFVPCAAFIALLQWVFG